jgi:hypothetical protein
MQYLLTENKSVLLGPIDWKPRFIQSELDDLEVDFKIPIAEPGYLAINETLEIIPVITSYKPAVDFNFEHLAGPFYTFTNNGAHEVYSSYRLSLDIIKENLHAIAAMARFRKEELGTKTTIQNLEVTVDTTRSSRNIFVQKYLLMSESDTVLLKFAEGWFTVTKAELGQVVQAGNNYIQAQFDAEKVKLGEIDAHDTFEGLQAVVIIPLPEVPEAPLGG